MAPDLLSTIRREIDERLSELRPLIVEHQQLLMAADALERTGQEDGSDARTDTAPPKPSTRRGVGIVKARRGSAAGAIKRAAARAVDVSADGGDKKENAKQLDADSGQRIATTPDAGKSKPARAARGAAREAILAALDHGSHTIGELVVVTAMSGPNINGNLRRLLSEGAVMKTEREGKTAWALVGSTV
jgi:porphobilinogen deaminase